jgi:hypothetical protein
MSCCGGKRRHWNRESSVASSDMGVSLTPSPEGPGVFFEYQGRTALTVRGPLTGRRYRFSAPGARVAVDARDAPAIVGVPNLKRV